jgi:hypothetical protein
MTVQSVCYGTCTDGEVSARPEAAAMLTRRDVEKVQKGPVSRRGRSAIQDQDAAAKYAANSRLSADGHGWETHEYDAASKKRGGLRTSSGS